MAISLTSVEQQKSCPWINGMLITTSLNKDFIVLERTHIGATTRGKKDLWCPGYTSQEIRGISKLR